MPTWIRTQVPMVPRLVGCVCVCVCRRFRSSGPGPGPGAGGGCRCRCGGPCPLHSFRHSSSTTRTIFPALIWPVASPPQPSDPQSLFSLVPSHRILHSSSAQIITSPHPSPSPSTNLPLPPSTLTCVAPSGILSCPPSINLDHGQIDFCVVQVRDSGACTQTHNRHRRRLFFFPFRGLFIQSLSSQDRVNESHGSRSKAANTPPPPGYEFPCSRVECSPAHGRLVRCPVHAHLSTSSTRCLPHLPRARPSPLSVRISYIRPPPDRSPPKQRTDSPLGETSKQPRPDLQVDDIVAEILSPLFVSLLCSKQVSLSCDS